MTATMTCGRFCRMMIGSDVGQLVAVVSPKPSMVLVCTVASPVAWRAAVMANDASCMTESPRIVTRKGRLGVITVPLGNEISFCWLYPPAPMMSAPFEVSREA